jgi:hypothetical protein
VLGDGLTRPVAVVAGMIATYPVGGVAWDYGQYLLGLERLGYETWYLEDTGWEAYDPTRGCYGDDYSYGLAFLPAALAAIAPELAGRWTVRDMAGRVHGTADDPGELVAAADLFLNVSGSALLRDAYLACPRKVLIDTDPGWNHFVNYPKWDSAPGWQGSAGWRAHDHFLTYAERIGQPGCALPDLGISWRPTRPPVVLGSWRPEPPASTWTTVMTWDNFRQPIEHGGVVYGTKEREFHRILELPARVGVPIEVAVGGDPPVAEWREAGWHVESSEAVSRTADSYRSYVQRSRGEVSVAKNLYVATGSGWFSCRSACYLAAGRPVVLQDTGFGQVLPTGDGLHAFADLDGAADAIRSVEAAYEHHCAAAREVAEAELASDVVLADLLESIHG